MKVEKVQSFIDEILNMSVKECLSEKFIKIEFNSTQLRYRTMPRESYPAKNDIAQHTSLRIENNYLFYKSYKGSFVGLIPDNKEQSVPVRDIKKLSRVSS